MDEVVLSNYHTMLIIKCFLLVALCIPPVLVTSVNSGQIQRSLSRCRKWFKIDVQIENMNCLPNEFFMIETYGSVKMKVIEKNIALLWCWTGEICNNEDRRSNT